MVLYEHPIEVTSQLFGKEESIVQILPTPEGDSCYGHIFKFQKHSYIWVRVLQYEKII